MWPLIGQYQNEIISAILSFVGGVLLEKYNNRKPDLPYYLLNSSVFNVPATPPAQAAQVYTHSIVIQNNGRAPATNIEVVHFNLVPQPVLFIYQVAPDVQVVPDRTPNGGLILRFSNLLPAQQITISYLYSYPYGVQNIHNYVKSSEVTGYPISVLSVRHTPKWLQSTLLWLALFGLIYSVQLLWVGIVHCIKSVVAG